jgi:hypothetical protein
LFFTHVFLYLKMQNRAIQILFFVLFSLHDSVAQQLPLLKISDNQRYFQTADGKPFFWLGDTGWLLFNKLKKEEVLFYLDTRQKQGFNVIQVMLLHELNEKNSYGGKALENNDITRPVMDDLHNIDPANYWSYIDFILSEASKRGIYVALVPVWGGAAKSGKLTARQAGIYALFLSQRFGSHNNIIWLNGGDIRGNELQDVWNAIGETLQKNDPKHHLIGFHPRGRYSSSEWFHNAPWLDFNMFQSGHRSYALDTSKNDKYHFGEDNWKYVQHDYSLTPAKPTFDGEPSYENIPQGLHDSLMPRWNDADVRRYAYWNVFAGGAGFTYGENAVMQFHRTSSGRGSYGVRESWTTTIHAKGAMQLKYLKYLILSKPYFERVPAQEIIADNSVEKYEYIVASKGKNYAIAYIYTGRNFSIDATKLGFEVTRSQWFSPSTGLKSKAVYKKHANLLTFDPPGNPRDGNDWVLILDGR